MDCFNYNRRGANAGRGRVDGSGVGRGRSGGGGGNNYQQHHQGQYQSGGQGGRGGGGRGAAQMGTNPPTAQPSGYRPVQAQSGAQRPPAVVGQVVVPTSGRGAWSRSPPGTARGFWANTVAGARAGAGQDQKRGPEPLPEIIVEKRMDCSNYNWGGGSAGRGRGDGSGVGRGSSGSGGVINYQQHHQVQYQGGGNGGGEGRGGAQMGTNPPPAPLSGYCPVQCQSGAQRPPAVVGQGVGPTSGRGSWSRGPPVTASGSWANTVAAGAVAVDGAGQAQKRDPEPLPDVQLIQISDSPPPSLAASLENGLLPMNRPDRGGMLSVLVNHFPVTFNPGSTIMHYDVDIKPVVTPGSRSVKISIPNSNLNLVREKLISDNASRFPLHMAAYDGEKNLFSAVPLLTDTNMTSAVDRVIGPPYLNAPRGADGDAVSSFGIIFSFFNIIDLFNCCCFI